MQRDFVPPLRLDRRVVETCAAYVNREHRASISGEVDGDTLLFAIYNTDPAELSIILYFQPIELDEERFQHRHIIDAPFPYDRLYSVEYRLNASEQQNRIFVNAELIVKPWQLDDHVVHAFTDDHRRAERFRIFLNGQDTGRQIDSAAFASQLFRRLNITGRLWIETNSERVPSVPVDMHQRYTVSVGELIGPRPLSMPPDQVRIVNLRI